MALLYRGIDTMGLTKDLMRQADPTTRMDNHLGTIHTDFPTVNLIGISFVNNTQAETATAGVSAFNEEPWTRKNRWMDKIHALGMNVLDRATDCTFEGLYDFSKVDRRNGNRYTYFATPITDNFDSDASRDHGYGLTSAAGNISTNYLTSHQASNSWSIVSDELTGPAASGWVRTILFNANNLGNLTATALVKKVGHQQLVIRATTDSNFPGYGLQMRDTNVLRIERPGLASLGEVPKTWVSGEYYWLKLQAIGSAIKGKAWAAASGTETFEAGQLTEPGTWDIEVTDTTYPSTGTRYVGFSGESDTGKFRYLYIKPEKDSNTWLARYLDKVVENMSHYQSGDILSPYPEATAHYPLTNEGTYVRFFSDVNYCVTRLGVENGKTLKGGFVGHLFTAALQGTFNSLYTTVGTATYDHYGTSIGRGKVFGSFSNDSGAAGTQTYTVPTSITEDATNRQDFIPEKVAYNKQIRVNVTDKGTGSLTMTIHGPDGNPVKMYDNTDLSISNNSYQATITNGNLVVGWNDFLIDWVNLDTDQTHHFHLTSSDGTVVVKTTTAGDLNTCSCIGYKWHATPEAYEIDIRNMYLKSGVPQFIQEWGDYWSTNASLTDPVLDEAEHTQYLTDFYTMLQRLVDDGILVGFNYWRSGFGVEGIYNNASGPGYTYTLQYNGEPLQDFFNANTEIPPDVVISYFAFVFS